MVNENFNRIQPDKQSDRQVANDKLSLLIVDDHELVRVGMRRLMEDASNVGSLYEAGSGCLLYTSPSPRDKRQSRMPSSA